MKPFAVTITGGGLMIVMADDEEHAMRLVGIGRVISAKPIKSEKQRWAKLRKNAKRKERYERKFTAS